MTRDTLTAILTITVLAAAGLGMVFLSLAAATLPGP